MWYVKDYLGNETGPYSFEELTRLLEAPLHRDNASLVRSGESGAWKPALLAFPDLIENTDTTSSSPTAHLEAANPYTPFVAPATKTPDSSTSKANPVLSRIAEDLNRTRFVLAVGVFYTTLLLYAVLNRASVQHVADNNPSLPLGNAMMACVIFMIFPLSTLVKIVRRKTFADPGSIQKTVSLHRKFWTGLFVAATLSIALLLFVLLGN